jgi:hypothetical protein
MHAASSMALQEGCVCQAMCFSYSVMAMFLLGRRKTPSACAQQFSNEA